MPRSSDRGYVEPLAALAAVLAVSIGLTVYATALEGTADADDRSVAETILAELLADAGSAGVVTTDRIEAAAPPGWHANVTLATRDGRVTWGPVPPVGADRATTRVAVRLGPATVRPGRLRVAVWQ